MHIFPCHPRPPESESLGWGLIICFDKFSWLSLCPIKWEKHCVRSLTVARASLKWQYLCITIFRFNYATGVPSSNINFEDMTLDSLTTANTGYTAYNY